MSYSVSSAAVAASPSGATSVVSAADTAPASPLATISPVAVASVPEVCVLSLRREIDSFPAQGALWQQLCAYAKARNVPVTGARFMVLHCAVCNSPTSGGIDIEVCLPIDSTATTTGDDIPVAAVNGSTCDGVCKRMVPSLAQAAVVTLVGPYSELPSAHRALRTWLNEQRVEAVGPMREVYHHQDYVNDPAGVGFVTDVVVPLE